MAYKFTYVGNNRILHQMRGTVGFDLFTIANDDSIGYHIIVQNGIYEPHLTGFLRDHILKPNIVAIDVGANAGYYSVMLAQAAYRDVGKGAFTGHGKVFIFEPNPEQAGIIGSNLMINAVTDYCEFFPYLVGEYEDQSRGFKIRDSYKGGCSVFDTMKFGDSYKSIGVKQVTLDNTIPVEQKIDLLRIDAEGADFHVIRGAERIINENKTIKVIFEYCETHLAAAGETRTGVFEWLKDRGFSFMVCNPNHTTEIAYDKLLTYMVKPTDLTDIVAYRE